jgi:hypothetical protein
MNICPIKKQYKYACSSWKSDHISCVKYYINIFDRIKNQQYIDNYINDGDND